MKRILSILMSVSLVAIMLVSMSVTSFAIDWTVKDNWNVLPENGTVTTIVTNVTDTEEADMFASNTLGEETFEAMKAYYPTDVYVFKIRQEITDLPLWTAKNGSKYYGLWLSGIAANYEFDINNIAYSEELEEYFFYQSEENYKYANFSAANLTDQGGFYLVGMTEDLTGNTFKALPPMNNELNEYPVGNGRGDYVLEFYVMTNTDTFDFNVCNLYYSTYELTSEEAQLNTKKPNSITVGSNTKKCLEQKVFSVVDGVLSSGEVETPKYTFTVYNENGSVLREEEVEEGAAIEMPTAPTVEGKTFSHWATEAGGSAVDPATTMGTEDLTYYAVYTVNKYTITFVVDGNTTTKEVEHGTVPTFDGSLVKEGHTFKGWDNEIVAATGAATYTAQFDINKYTITFIVDGNTTTKEVVHGTIPTFDGSLVKDGYTFTGWDKEIVAATGAATYTAQFEKNAPTQYEITFVVDGKETKVMTNAGETPVFPGAPAKDGYNFIGWTPALAPATGAATYTAQFELIPPTESVLEITTVDRIPGDIFPGTSEPTVDVIVKGATETVSAARLHRVHTKFDYEAGANPLVEMGMLFVPKAVADKAGVSTAEEIVAAGIAKDANCSNLPGEITGGTTNVVFKAGLINVPEAHKGITIYAIPYYTLSGGARQYHSVIETTF